MQLKNKLFLKVVLTIIACIIILKLSVLFILEPWLRKKTLTTLNEMNCNYAFELNRADVSFFPPGLNFELIKFQLIHEQDKKFDGGGVGWIHLAGINVIKALFMHKVDIRNVTIHNSNMEVGQLFLKKSGHPMKLPMDLHIEKIYFDTLDVTVFDTANKSSYIIQNGGIVFRDINVIKNMPLSFDNIGNIDFSAAGATMITPDSMYSFSADRITFSASSGTLLIDTFNIHPNYKAYDFTSRYKYQTDRIEIKMTACSVYNFSLAYLLSCGDIECSYFQVNNFNSNIFRDRRKEFRHEVKPVFQDLLYHYPHRIRVDSIHIADGDLRYTEHAEGASHPGYIDFGGIKSTLYNITNDTLRKASGDTLKAIAEARVMNKSKLRLTLNGKLFDPRNRFSAYGTLSPMDAKDFNPILSHNAFMYVTSGKINALKFNFTADNYKATGKVIFLYDHMAIALKNKSTDDTTGLKEKVLTKIANKILIDSNPIPGESVRTGVIDYDRDPEKKFFNYCLKALLTGIKSSVSKVSKNKK